ncbi:LuxR C-terminal-related transcriptional regulator [Micromonospora sp. NPDC050686]|uniref:ATP-binding protein n=1 Tax=Micromonospora sp. NPDC050686 TaxID=3154631 RepID=UPI00340FC71F
MPDKIRVGDDGEMTLTGPDEISKREAQVLDAVTARMSNAEIAEKLYISVRTVESHVSSLLRKFGVPDRSALAECALHAQDDAPPPIRIAGLPAAWTTFIGRDSERAAVVAALDNTRLVTLVGPGGVGKTRIATVLADAEAKSFPGGGAFVDLVPVRDAFVAQAVATALGVTESPQQPLEEAIAGCLGSDRSILVLDNCEHVLDATAGFVERLLAACPGTRVLVTSRARLGLPGERLVVVEPLPLASEAEALFHDRAATADPEFTADPEVITEICARLDGMPLAIELAAARSASLGANGLLATLDDTLRLLVSGRGPDARHRSLRAVIGWSHNLLDDEERALFRQLAVFAGGFDLDAVLAVTLLGDRAAVADVLGRLVDKSLVVHQRAVGRWRLLETVRAFALHQLDGGDDRADVQDRHMRWAATHAALLEDRLGGEWRDAFDAVVDDLRAALANAAPGPGSVPHRLARSLGHLTYARRFLMESLGHFKEAATRATEPAEAARDLRSAADCVHVSTRSGLQSFELLLASARQAQTVGDGNAQAIALCRAAETACRFPARFPVEIPQERLRQLVDQAATTGDAAHPVVAAHLATAAAWTLNPEKYDPDPALAEAAVIAARSTSDPVLISASIDALGAAAVRRGRLREAHRLTRQRLTLMAAMDRDDPHSAPEIMDIFMMASADAIMTGDLAAAISTARQFLDDDLLGNQSHIAASPMIPALVLAGDVEEALRYAERLWDGWTRAGRRHAGWMWSALWAVVLAHGLRRDTSRYALWRARVAEVAGAANVSPTRLSPVAAFIDARLAIHNGDVTGASALVERAIAGAPAGLHRYETYARATGAELAVLAGLPNAAAWLASVAPTVAENDWAAACLARATGRLHQDVAALTAAVEGWERVGARFERACTLLLLPERVAEGHAELSTLGLPAPA